MHHIHRGRLAPAILGRLVCSGALAMDPTAVPSATSCPRASRGARWLARGGRTSPTQEGSDLMVARDGFMIVMDMNDAPSFGVVYAARRAGDEADRRMSPS
jgi:hypothetical protein